MEKFRLTFLARSDILIAKTARCKLTSDCFLEWRLSAHKTSCNPFGVK